MAYTYEKKEIKTAGDLIDTYKHDFNWEKSYTPNIEFDTRFVHAYVTSGIEDTLEFGWVNTGLLQDGLYIYEAFGLMDPILRYKMHSNSIGSQQSKDRLAVGLRVPRVFTPGRIDTLNIDKIRGFVLSGIRAVMTPYRDFQVLHFPFKPGEQGGMVHPMPIVTPEIPIMWAPLTSEQIDVLIQKSNLQKFDLELTGYLANLIHHPNKQLRVRSIDQLVNNPLINRETLQVVFGMVQSKNTKKSLTLDAYNTLEQKLTHYSDDDIRNLIDTFAIDESKKDIPTMRVSKGVKTLNKKGLHKKKITKSYAKEITSKVWPSVADQKQWTKGRLQDHVYQMLTGTESHGGVLNMFRDRLNNPEIRTNVVFMDSLAAQISLSLAPETPNENTKHQNELVVDTPTPQLASASFEKVKAFYIDNMDRDISAPGMEAWFRDYAEGVDAGRLQLNREGMLEAMSSGLSIMDDNSNSAPQVPEPVQQGDNGPSQLQRIESDIQEADQSLNRLIAQIRTRQNEPIRDLVAVPQNVVEQVNQQLISDGLPAMDKEQIQAVVEEGLHGLAVRDNNQPASRWIFDGLGRYVGDMMGWNNNEAPEIVYNAQNDNGGGAIVGGQFEIGPAFMHAIMAAGVAGMIAAPNNQQAALGWNGEFANDQEVVFLTPGNGARAGLFGLASLLLQKWITQAVGFAKDMLGSDLPWRFAMIFDIWQQSQYAQQLEQRVQILEGIGGNQEGIVGPLGQIAGPGGGGGAPGGGGPPGDRLIGPGEDDDGDGGGSGRIAGGGGGGPPGDPADPVIGTGEDDDDRPPRMILGCHHLEVTVVEVGEEEVLKEKCQNMTTKTVNSRIMAVVWTTKDLGGMHQDIHW